MQRIGVPARKAAKRDQRGPLNPCWKGDKAGYQAMHLRVRTARGNPTSCSICQRSGCIIDWANLSGNYADVADYAAMCRSCHTTYDGRVANLRGAQ